MKQKSFYSLLVMGVLLLTSYVLSACREDLPKEFTSEYIVINYTDSLTEAESSIESQTRSESGGTRAEGILTGQFGKKLYWRCTEGQWQKQDARTTRGSKITTANISEIGVCSSVYPQSGNYEDYGCGSYFYKESVAPGVPTGFFWPTENYKVSFFAYYPYGNSDFTVQSPSNDPGAPTYGYTVPTTISSQQDIMTGQVVNRLGGTATPVNMSLSHRCSAVNITIENERSSSITVSSVSIEGVKFSGTLNENTWSLGATVNSSSLNPFMLTCNTTIAAGNSANLTGSNNVFLMLPQTLPATAKLKVVADGETFEGSISGSWEAGVNYIYTLSFSDSWEYILTVSEPVAFSYAGGTNSYSIQSYRSKNSGAVTENVGWTATYDTNGDGIYNDSQPAWLTAFTGSGAGSVTASNYSATVAAQSAVIGTASDTYSARSCSVKIAQNDAGGGSQTFTVTQNAFTDTYTYTFSVSGPAAYEYTGGTKTYSVTSYKQNSARTTAVPWTANATANSSPAWITAFTNSATPAGSAATSYNLTVAAQSGTNAADGSTTTYAARSQTITFTQGQSGRTGSFTVTQNAHTDNWTVDDEVSVGNWSN